MVLYTADKDGNYLKVANARTKDGNNPADDGEPCPPRCPGLVDNSRFESNPINEVGDLISKDQGDSWVKRFQTGNEGSTFGFRYGKDLTEEMLATEGVEGIWFYLGINETFRERSCWPGRGWK